MSYDVWGDGEDPPECASCAEAQKDYEVLLKITDDLVALVQRLAHSLDKPNGNTLLARKAMDYLNRQELLGSPLRKDDQP